MAAEWPGCEYNLIHHNCLSFCNVLLEEKLQLRRIPGWVDRAARAASKVDNAVQLLRGISTDQIHDHAEKSIDNIRNDTLAALKTAQEESSKLFETAQEESSKFIEAAQVEVNQHSIEVQKAAEKASEDLKALGASIWQWGQETAIVVEQKVQETVQEAEKTLQAVGEEVEKTVSEMIDADPSRGTDEASRSTSSSSTAPVPKISEVASDVAKTVEETATTLGQNLLWFGQELQKDIERAFDDTPSQPREEKRRSKKSTSSSAKTSQPRDLLGDYDDDDDEEVDGQAKVDPRGTSGMIKAQERSLMSRGLLDPSDSEEDTPAPASNGIFKRSSQPASVVQAPAEWTATSATPAASSTGQRDLLDDWNAEDTSKAPEPAASPAPAAGGGYPTLNLMGSVANGSSGGYPTLNLKPADIATVDLLG
eukprot:TRINITY_DN65684_c0_g1_i1.p1 TRINITY_DN65684_c0_g1~~TRINITY_DN65684_c0_g1_i1.p1  ORF type:complete len:488 (-),score=138.26 TRINITY_DN65684_c0_g1_i1:57-1325(-)